MVMARQSLQEAVSKQLMGKWCAPFGQAVRWTFKRITMVLKETMSLLSKTQHHMYWALQHMKQVMSPIKLS